MCSVPFIEGTVKVIPAYIRRGKAAIAKVQNVALQDVKNACLVELARP